MTTAARASVAAVVVAGQGGDALRAALERAAWADERLVLDPAERVVADALPAGVGRVTRLRALAGTTTSAWMVLLQEADHLDEAGVGAVRTAVARARPGDVFCIPVVTELLDFALVPKGLGIWIAERQAPVRIGRDFQMRLGSGGRGARTLPVRAVRRQGADVTAALELLNAESTTLAAAVARLGGRRSTALAAVYALGAAARSLLARTASGRLGLGRWMMAVFGGYRVLLAHAKLWELERDRVLERG